MDSATQTITIKNHNLKNGDYLFIEDTNGVALSDDTLQVIRIDENTITANRASIPDFFFTGTYTGGGKVGRISNLKILSKQFNPGTPVGLEFQIAYADFLLEKTGSGQISLEYFLNTTSGDTIYQMVNQGNTDPNMPNVLLGNVDSNILFTKPEDDKTFQPLQDQIWHRFYLQVEGAFIQLVFFMSDDQMRTRSKSQQDFQLHAILLYVESEGRIIG